MYENRARLPVAGVFMVLSVGCTAAAQTIYVAPCGDDLWTGANSTCTAPDGPKHTLQAAINAARDGDEIVVAAGTYHEAIDFNGKAIHLRSIDGAAATIVDASGLNTSVVTCTNHEGLDTILEGFTIRGGVGRLDYTGVRYGGGMYNLNSSPTVIGCTFTGNAAVSGGGMFNWYAGSPTVIRCTFSQNTAGYRDPNGSWFGAGGGMYNGGSDFGSSPTVTDCTFSENFAPSGGGMYNAGHGNFIVTNCTFTGNSALYGGGMVNYSSGATVTGCAFTGNSVDGYGGGMLSTWNSPAEVNDCIFVGNSAGDGGGGMAIYNRSRAKINHCTFSGNTADRGAGLYALVQALVTNSILWGDTPDEINPDSAATVTYCDVKGGFAGAGNLDADPLFVNAAAGDVHLEPGSPCIDRGTIAGLASGSDADGRCRVMDGDGDGSAIIDLGPFEAVGLMLDCNGNGVCETQEPASIDCNRNLIPDDCDIAHGWSPDVIPESGNGRPDECERVHNVTRDLHHSAIQFALDAANGGDEVIVAPGEYREAIDFNGKAVNLHSSHGPAVTIIDASGWYASVITCANGEGPGTIIEGFTITGGDAYYYGGGMYIEYASPMVQNCIITENAAYYDGGAMFNRGSPTILNCAFNRNSAQYGSGGMYTGEGSPKVANCTFSANARNGMHNSGGNPIVSNCTFSEHSGNGFLNDGGRPTLINCTFSGNGFGIGSYSGRTTVTNCILWGDASGEIDQFATVTNSDVQGGYPGAGNLDVDPLFVNASNSDFRLASDSPCIDAGTNARLGAGIDPDGHCRIMDGDGDGLAIVDMGAFETEGPVLDCNGNTLCDTQEPAAFDCNRNQIPDDCDIRYGWSSDVIPVGGNGRPDECERVRNLTRELHYTDIQPAIDGAADGDELVVAPGTYYETINLLGKGIYLHSSSGSEATILDATGSFCSVITCAGGEGSDTILDGFTITGGSGTDDCWGCWEGGIVKGGGMYIVGASPTVTNCTFRENRAMLGGGIYNEYANPTVMNCTLIGNGVAAHSFGGGGGLGGGMYNEYSSPTVTNCTFIGNRANTRVGFGGFGGGICNGLSSPTVAGCAFVGNSADVAGGAMTNFASSHPTATNSILWRNVPDEISLHTGSSATVTFGDVDGGWPGIGNIDAQPLFVRYPSDGGDGWGDDPNTPGVNESANDDYGDLRFSAASPCIDAGDPAYLPPGGFDFAGHVRVWDGDMDDVPRIDMGAFEFDAPIPGDVDGDCQVGLRDLVRLLAQFGTPTNPTYGDGDLDFDGNVDLSDLTLLLAAFGTTCR